METSSTTTNELHVAARWRLWQLFVTHAEKLGLAVKGVDHTPDGEPKLLFEHNQLEVYSRRQRPKPAKQP